MNLKDFFRVELSDWPRKQAKVGKVMFEIIWALGPRAQKENCHGVIYLKKEKQQGLKLTSQKENET